MNSLYTENKTWESIRSMNIGRVLSTATTWNGYVYIAGGFTTISTKPITTSVELYDPTTDEWSKILPMNRPRHSFVLTETNGFLYAIGHDKVIEKFDPYKNCWKLLVNWMTNRTITQN